MNTRNLPASVLLLAIGAGAVLVIGAFARFDPASSPHPATSSATPPPLTQDDPPTEAAAESALPVDLSPGLAEIIKLAQAHVDESVIVAYVKNSGQVFSPTADEILYLSDLGLSQDVIGILVKSAPAASAAQKVQETAAALPPTPLGLLTAAAQSQPDATNSGVFFSDLASYGTWAQQPDYGLCWQPTVETIDPDWRPYVDAGQWLYSDCGWYWQSDYTWGWAAFHYGRWAKVPRLGWVWVPGNIWAPAWVAWRSSSECIGWAPLPPGVGLNVLAQLTYLGHPAGANSTFGLSPSAYTFVNTGELTSRHLPRHVLSVSRVNTLVRDTIVIDSYAIVNHKIFNGGANRETVAAAANKPVSEVTLRGVSSPQAAGLAMDRKTLAVYCPPVSSTGASTAKALAANSSAARVPAAAEKQPPQEPMLLADNDSAEISTMPIQPDDSQKSVQLPPLRYPTPVTPQMVHQHRRENMVAAAPDSTPASRGWPRGNGATAVERPVTPAPRYDGFNPPARQNELPRPATDNHPAPAEYRPAPVEPARVAPAPSSSPSRSGK
ncbi:MAG TPA: DUF6600 domain-containing protein [Candidatus Cybelea sp.]|nr:DUF6600 domain-containing protein [Candidatus Cybelea sp.]